ncbi:hypothetical protein CWI39_0135p0030 [Hamiltosporidium magnivora]|uniref:EB1 C-terminal domain-containing protein n=1 Tax=Hamiltosporidium magnivora TaxID=148818 RepID=A0A4Q9LKP1_9MICR|nr:hypothetical protein CWI39_0135p0030 [Hamiltosporidium magnivora]
MKSRIYLENWVMSLLDLKEKKTVEKFGCGVEYALVLSKIYSDFPLKQINTAAIRSDEFLCNLRVVKTFLDSKGVVVYMPIEKMVNCKTMDNLEFTQWLYKHFNDNLVLKKENKTIENEISPQKDQFKISPKTKNSPNNFNEIKNQNNIQTDKNLNTNNFNEIKKEDFSHKNVNQIQNETQKSNNLINNENIYEKMLNEKEEEIKNYYENILTEKMEEIKNYYEQILNETGLENLMLKAELKNKMDTFVEEKEKNIKMEELIIAFEKERDFYFKKLYKIEEIFLNWDSNNVNIKELFHKALYDENNSE